MNKGQRVSLVIDWFAYIGLFSVAIYFIQKADVWDRYQLGRTNFAEYEEPISERPTIIAYIDPMSMTANLTYGQDFNISYFVSDRISSLQPAQRANLTNGENFIKDGFLIDFEEVYQGNMFKITPMTLNYEDNDYHSISFVFHPSKNDTARDLKIVIRLSSENSSIYWVTSKTNDGCNI